jgi:hypothetical protein
MAQAARLLTGAALQLLVAEFGLTPHLGGDHIGLLQLKTGSARQGQKFLQVGRILAILQAERQLGIATGAGEEGIELLQAHGPLRQVEEGHVPV